MRTALITTTVNVPHVLRLYRRFGPDVRFFIAIDKKTPEAALDVLESLDNCEPVVGEEWKCSELIGWNCIQRRNVALLEALKWGADVIVSVDDDNLCLDQNYFLDFQRVLYSFGGYGKGFYSPPVFDGLRATAREPHNWFDVGRLLDPPCPHRGFPITELPAIDFEPVTDAKVGVAAGICLGDPDTSAFFRIANKPTVHNVSQLLTPGVVVDPHTWTVFNSQNSAIIRELAPAWGMWCGVGRYDDILASLVVQRVMRSRGYHVHFGKPYVWQSRNQHDLVRDLGNELFGMRRIVEIAEFLEPLCLASSVIGDCRFIFTELQKFPWIPPHTISCALAFLDDCDEAMKPVEQPAMRGPNYTELAKITREACRPKWPK